MRNVWVIVALVLASAGMAGADRTRQVKYIGIHPSSTSEGERLCHIEGPHVHSYDADRLRYRDLDGYHFFISDPVAYGYDGRKFAYQGHHPVHVRSVDTGEPRVEFCYLDGPHYHSFRPPEGPDFQFVGNAYFYVLNPPIAYHKARWELMKINAIHARLAYARPVVTAAAPAGWIGTRMSASGIDEIHDDPCVGFGVDACCGLSGRARRQRKCDEIEGSFGTIGRTQNPKRR